MELEKIFEYELAPTDCHYSMKWECVKHSLKNSAISDIFQSMSIEMALISSKEEICYITLWKI